MRSYCLKVLSVATCLLLATPSFAKKWCCEKDGVLQVFPDSNKRMCIKGKKAPSVKSKAEGKRGKYYKACNDFGGKWVVKTKAKAPSK